MISVASPPMPDMAEMAKFFPYSAEHI